MSVLDGYKVVTIPEPRTESGIVWSRTARVHAGPAGTAWTGANHALMSFHGYVWKTEAPENPGETMIGAIPAGAREAIVLFADRLALYHAGSASRHVLKTVSMRQPG